MATATKKKETPLMGQYNKIKSKYPDAILLFRVGDFYETFGKDAIIAADILGIVLTKRSNGAASEMELAGFPHHSLNTYLPKLVRAGYRVAICDQLEDPKQTKTIVRRGVTELITPGVAHNDEILDRKSNNFLASIHFAKKLLGISFLDISTGEFLVSEGDVDYIDKLLQNFLPSEVIFSKDKQRDFVSLFGNQYYTYALDNWIYDFDYAQEKLITHFEVKNLKGFGIEEFSTGVIAAGTILHYIADTEHKQVKHISHLSRIEKDRYVWLDRFTTRNLELISSNHPDGKSLVDVLDKTLSPMGSRLLKRWVVLPLLDINSILHRQKAVETLIKNQESFSELQQHIKSIGDLERLISKVSMGKINPREVLQIKRSLYVLEPIKSLCEQLQNTYLKQLADQINPCQELKKTIDNTIEDEPPALIQKGGVIKEGINPELDDLRAIQQSGKSYLLKIQETESKHTGIPSLKIKFNNVFGYYLEVTNAHKDKVPDNWIRKQTLVNAERYITEELKEYEQKILGAEEKILQLEIQLFNQLVASLSEYIQSIQLNAQAVAILDCLQSFATVALKNNYKAPDINDSLIIDIKKGRHPVIEEQLPLGEAFIPNDVYLDSETQQLLMITGPNMAGKSAVLRQTALICLMAQMGAFVPANAKLGIIDKVFTRVGASDNISSGESTFMVEMNETASILNNISPRSLILLDEIGRGTSTYDGISIAWSIAEFLHNNTKDVHPKTLFATHYHELNTLEEQYNRIVNYNIATKETDNKVIFLRKLTKGGSNHSFGIHVAKMAGMPKEVINRANQILSELEQKHLGETNTVERKLRKIPAQDLQLSFFGIEDAALLEIKEKLTKLDLNTLSPIEAMMQLNELKKLIP